MYVSNDMAYMNTCILTRHRKITAHLEMEDRCRLDTYIYIYMIYIYVTSICDIYM